MQLLHALLEVEFAPATAYAPVGNPVIVQALLDTDPLIEHAPVTPLTFDSIIEVAPVTPLSNEVQSCVLHLIVAYS